MVTAHWHPWLWSAGALGRGPGEETMCHALSLSLPTEAILMACKYISTAGVVITRQKWYSPDCQRKVRWLKTCQSVSVFSAILMKLEKCGNVASLSKIPEGNEALWLDGWTSLTVMWYCLLWSGNEEEVKRAFTANRPQGEHFLKSFVELQTEKLPCLGRREDRFYESGAKLGLKLVYVLYMKLWDPADFYIL